MSPPDPTQFLVAAAQPAEIGRKLTGYFRMSDAGRQTSLSEARRQIPSHFGTWKGLLWVGRLKWDPAADQSISEMRLYDVLA